MPVALVIPVKRLELAKSRLGLRSPERAAVARWLVRHTLTVAADCTSVGLVTVVTEDPDVGRLARAAGAVVTAEPRPGGLVAAALEGRRTSRRLAPHHDLAVMVSDLPHLGTSDLDSAFAEFTGLGVPMFVPDHLGTGTTMLVHPHSAEPPILFGQDSARRHADAGYAASRSSLPGLREDLDTRTDLVRSRLVANVAMPA